MEDVVAIVMVFGTAMLGVIAFSPLGKAIADRLRGHRGDPAPLVEIEELRDQVAQLSQQISELAERQDFAERLLAQTREKGSLGPGAQP